MTNLSIDVIRNTDGMTVRAAGTLEKPLFMAKDVVEAVGAVWNGASNISHVPEEFRVISDMTLQNGKIVQVWYFTELGLYFYLNRSDSPLALPWQRRVAEILRELRMKGSVDLEQFHKLQYNVNLLTVENENLVEENLLLKGKSPFVPRNGGFYVRRQ